MVPEGVSDDHHWNTNPCSLALTAVTEFGRMYVLSFLAASPTNCAQDLKVKLVYFWLVHHQQ